MRRSVMLFVGICVFSVTSSARAQVVNPAERPSGPGDPRAEERPRTYDMPPIDVFGQAPLRDDDLIGNYAQPRWTADRLFSETRVYVIPKGKVEFEYWMRADTPKNGPSNIREMFEVEFGLPGRLQVDMYTVRDKLGETGTASFDTTQVELRWALADWGKIWGNPTTYWEWKQSSDGFDAAEIKLLLGGNIASGWHWGSNFVWEREMGGAQETSNEWTVGISRTVRDRKVNLGVETQLAFVNERDRPGHRTEFSKEFLIGPSFSSARFRKSTSTSHRCSVSPTPRSGRRSSSSSDTSSRV